MNEDSDIYTVCGQCHVKISGPTSEAVNIAFRGHEKEAHGYMTGQEWYSRFKLFIDLAIAGMESNIDQVMTDPQFSGKEKPKTHLTKKGYLALARKAAGLEESDE